MLQVPPIALVLAPAVITHSYIQKRIDIHIHIYNKQKLPMYTTYRIVWGFLRLCSNLIEAVTEVDSTMGVIAMATG